MASNHFSTSGNNGFGTPPYTLHYTYSEPLNPTSINGNVLTFDGTNSEPCWPLLDINFYGYYHPVYYIRLELKPDCDAPTSGNFIYSGSYNQYTSSAYPADYQISNSFNITSQPIYHVEPVVSIVPPASDIHVYGNNLNFTFLICDNQIPTNTVWLAFENSGYHSLDLANAVIQNITNPGASISQIGYNSDQGLLVDVGAIPASQCQTFSFTAPIINPQGCVPSGTSISDYITILYGNDCADDLTGISSPSDFNCPQSTPVDVSFIRYPSDLEMELPNGYPASSVDLCTGTQLTYEILLNSSEEGTIFDPSFWMYLPTGVVLNDITFTYPANGGNTYQFPNDLTDISGNIGWSLNNIPYILSHGFTGTTTNPYNSIHITVNVTFICGYNPNDYLHFFAEGINTCNEQIITQEILHRPIVNGSPVADDISVSMNYNGSSILECNQSGNIYVHVINNGTNPTTHNHTLTVEIPSEITVFNTNGTIGSNQVTWNINSIPPNTEYTYMFSIELAGYSCNISPGYEFIATVGYTDIITCSGQPDCEISNSTTPVSVFVNACCGCQVEISLSENVLCYGNSTGSATANMLGGIPPFTYLWSDGQTTASAIGLFAGSYSVTATDAVGCSAVADIYITQPNQIVLDILSNNSSCNGENDGTATVNVSGGTPGYSYTWSTIPVQTTPNATGLIAGTYYITIEDNNHCIQTSSVTITEPAILLASINTFTNVLCFGENTGNATVSVTGGTPPYTYFWDNPSGSTSQTATSLTSGIYNVTVTDNNNCTTSASIVIAQPSSSVQCSISSSQNVNCFGGNDGSATVSASGGTPGYSYLWTPSGQTTTTATGLIAGNYSVVVTDANSCSHTAYATITQPLELVVIPFINSQPLCFGTCNGEIGVTITGGTTPYMPSWDNGLTTFFNDAACAGYNTVTITDGHGCISSATVNISAPPGLIASVAFTDVLCFDNCDGTATVNPSGGTPPYTNYMWSTFPWSPFPFQHTQTETNLCAGIFYAVQVTDANGCTAVSPSFILTEPPALTLSLNHITNTCIGANHGIIDVIASGGTPSYQYDIGAGIQTSGVFQNLAAGNYTVTVTDNNNCSTTFYATVNEIQVISITETITDNNGCVSPCNGNIVLDIAPPGNYTFAWQNIAGQNISPPNNNLCAGTYFVTVTDDAGCTASGNWFVDDLPFTSCDYNPSANIYVFGDNHCYSVPYIDVNFYLGQNLYNQPLDYDIEGFIYLMEDPQTLQGATLTITNGARLHFREWCRIIVNPRCTLNVTGTGTTLTSCNTICPNPPMWLGIIAVSHSPDKICIVHIADNPLIENAVNAVYADGYVKVTSSIANYHNNRRSIRITNTPFVHHIERNNFIIDFNFFQHFTAYPDWSIYLYNNSMPLDLYNNYFENSRLWLIGAAFDRSDGIIADKTNIVVKLSYFEGLQYGVRSNANSVIVESEFINNNRAIRIQGITSSGSEVYSNTIQVGNNGYNIADPAATINWGIAFLNTPVFQVYENQISNGLVGILTNTTQLNGNVIYNNTFTSMYASCVANGDNGGLLYNCNNFFEQTTTHGTFPGFLGGDMVVFNNGSVFDWQAHYTDNQISTYNQIDRFNNNCIANPSQHFFNDSGNDYTYLFCNDGDESDISNCSDNVTLTGDVNALPDPPSGLLTDYIFTVGNNCLTGPPVPGGGIKSFSVSFFTADSLSVVKEYQQNVLQSLTDNGNTTYFLNKIADLAPNNFIKFYNELMASSPYLSDDVLIPFMLNSINRPVHKKNVILACSPLPLNVRPYIDQMNVNQNFKNQIWAAQSGQPNARVQLENYIKWLSNRRQVEINGLAVRCNSDSLGFETDSLIAYLGNSAILDDRIIRYGLCMKKADYSTASTELYVINGLTGDLSLQKQQEFEDFKDVAGILINSLLADSLADSVIIINQSFLTDIAETEFHLAQGDAKALLEQAGIQQEYYVWLPNGSISKKANKSETEEIISEVCRLLEIFPNPSSGNMTVKYNLTNEEGTAEISFTSADGKQINRYLLNERKGEIQVNCNECTTGQYILSLLIEGRTGCSKIISIKK
jgi:hypothetical protein